MMRRDMDEHDLHREASDFLDEIIEERVRMDSERKDGLYYDEETSVNLRLIAALAGLVTAAIGVVSFFAVEVR